MKVMFLGTSSGAGKTVITAITCRHMRRKGMSVAPYKTLNLSLNSHVTADGHEIGTSQAFQSWACGIEADARMNPILLKPKGNRSMQVILCGKPFMDVVPGKEADREHLMSNAMAGFRSLEGDYDAIILEGSGSPVELNLRDQDIANVRTARETRSPIIIVGDIDKGGVFAGILGTFILIPPEDRHLVKGFLINRFRGDGSILGTGIRRLEEEMGVSCLGVMPFLPLRLPQEDSLSLSVSGTMQGVDDVMEGWMRNLDKLTDAAEQNLDMDLLERIMSEGV